MSKASRPSGATKPTTPKRAGQKLPPLVIAKGTLVDEDVAACSFSADDVRRLIGDTGIKPVAGLAMEEIAIWLKDAVIHFLVSRRLGTSTPPGDTANRVREIEKRALDFLKIMDIDPDDVGQTMLYSDAFQILLSGPTSDPRYITHEDRQTFLLRESMARHPFYGLGDTELSPLIIRLTEHPHVFVPSPHQAIESGLLGAAYVACLAAAAAKRYDEVKGRTRQEPEALLVFVDDINKIYTAITGKQGSITTDHYDSAQKYKGAIIGFTQLILRRTGNLLPERPAIPADAGMRLELLDLAESPTKTVSRIRSIRSRGWKARGSGGPE